MPKWLLILVVFFPFNGNGQWLKLVERHNPNQLYSEKYWVVRKDTTMRHGPYMMYHYFDGKPIKLGFYKFGKKDSLWREYCEWCDFVQITGKYQDDKKVGVWTVFRAKDDTELIYDYSRASLVKFTNDTTATYAYRKNKAVLAKLDRPPIYVEGKLGAMNFIATHLHYPDSCYKAGIHGTVQVAIEIKTNGKMGRTWVKKSVHKTLDEAALNVVNLLPEKWIPALQRNEPVPAVYYIDVPFVLM
jgi:TonB family protein